MRSQAEIKKKINGMYPQDQLQTEVLLDIRTLLVKILNRE